MPRVSPGMANRAQGLPSRTGLAPSRAIIAVGIVCLMFAGLHRSMPSMEFTAKVHREHRAYAAAQRRKSPPTAPVVTFEGDVFVDDDDDVYGAGNEASRDERRMQRLRAQSDKPDLETAAWCSWNSWANNFTSSAATEPAGASPHGDGGDQVVCFGDAWRTPAAAASMLHLVVTARASELTEAAKWLVDVPFPTTVYVKADVSSNNSSDSARRIPSAAGSSRDSATDDEQQQLYAVPGFRDRLRDLESLDLPPALFEPHQEAGSPSSGGDCGRRAATVIGSVSRAIRRHYSAAWQTDLVGHLRSTEPVAIAERLANATLRRVVARRRAKHFLQAKLTWKVQRNVGDEAAAIADFTASFPGAGSTDGERAPKFVAFVHAHRSSWHALDILRQLRCTCLNPSSRRYVTLMAPSRAFLYQCAGYDAADDANAVTAAICNGAGSTGRDESSSSPAPTVHPELAGMQRRAAARRAATVANHAMARRLLLSSGRMDKALLPNELARDCCTTFIARADAILEASTVARGMREVLLSQPRGGDDDGGSGDGGGTLFEELSMYAERLWRSVFRPSAADIRRDLTTLGCGVHVAAARRADLRQQVAACEGEKVVSDVATCAPNATLNRFALD